MKVPTKPLSMRTPVISGRNWNSGKIAVFWHDRPVQLGQQILAIAKKADQTQAQLFGLELKHPYRIVIFNTEEEFFGWNVDSSDYVAGQSYPFYDLTVQIVKDDSLEWLNDVIPHEISHLYFEQVTYHPKAESYPPAWLNEGVAVYNEFSDHSYEDQILRKAATRDGIMPLYELANTFGEDDDRVDLAYAEGYSAVSYLMGQYGCDGLKKLMNSYRRGVSTDEAFTSVINKTSTVFEMEWKAWLKEKYSNELETPVEKIPLYEPTISGEYISLYLALCALGFTPLLCLITTVTGTVLGLITRQNLRS
jgi:hypothetical protein